MIVYSYILTKIPKVTSVNGDMRRQSSLYLISVPEF